MWKTIGFLCVLVLLETTSSGAQVFQTLVNFDGTEGSALFTTPVQALIGNFFGATYQRGASNHGAVFEVTPTAR